MVAAHIRAQLEELDRLNTEDETVGQHHQSSVGPLTHTILGASKPPASFKEIESRFAEDPAFHNFRKHLSLHFTWFLKKEIKFEATDTVSTHSLNSGE